MKTVNSMLVIDDNEISCLLISKVIDYANFTNQLNTFQQAEEALSFLSNLVEHQPTKFPQVIFLDVNMPRMNGWAFLEFYEQFPASLIQDCKLFMLSASIDEEDRTKALNYKSVTDYIIKPITKNVLQELSSKYFQQQL